MNQHSKIAVVGYGVEGQAMLKYLVKNKFTNLTVCDQKVDLKAKIPNGVSVRLGKDYLEKLSDFEVIFRSPGVPHGRPEFAEASVLGSVVTSPTQYFLENCPCVLVGVTGTKGKGTTSTLIYEILSEGFKKGGAKGGGKTKDGAKTVKNRHAYLGGNIGNPPIEFLDKVKPLDVVVLEMSCFQLGDLNKSPHIAVLLNTTEDHLDYYPDRDAYLAAKELILTHQNKESLAVLNFDYPYTKYYKPLVKGRMAMVSAKGTKVKYGAYVSASGTAKAEIIYVKDGLEEKIMKASEVGLIGSHNLENICPAITVAKEFGVSNAVIKKVVKQFKGLPHRLEFVRKVRGVSYYNDSFSTNPMTSMAAVDSFNVPTVLLAGGSDKGLSYADWARKILTKENLKMVVLYGDTQEKMFKALVSAADKLKDGEITPTEIAKCENLKQAIEVGMYKAEEMASKKGSVVVMSPAAASFDQFKDYKERGKKFGEWVNEL